MCCNGSQFPVGVVVLTLTFLAQAGAAAPAAAAADNRPNILFALADDWAWPHAGVYGDKVVKTPTFDRVAREGVLFRSAYVAAPTCTASRGGILTGQAIHRLEEGANLWSLLPKKFPVYPDVLEEAGYFVGFTRKGWGPGALEGSGRTRNPAGPQFKSFQEFFQRLPQGKPFCFWFGSTDPHRPYVKDSGIASGMKPAEVVVPLYLPDTPAVRKDMLDYYFAVQRFDREVGEILKALEDAGKLDNTLVVLSGDNGIPFPRAKATLYDSGTHAPLAVRWPAKVRSGRVVDDFVSLIDLCPTFLEAAGLKPLAKMTGKSFLDVLLSDKSGRVDPGRDWVVSERERHADARAGNKSYPVRALRTSQFHYIRNLRPDLWPAGDPEHAASMVGTYGDVDASPSKSEILEHRDAPAIGPYFKAAFAKRPAEELYDVAQDPDELFNLAGKPEYAEVQAKLRAQLDRWMSETADPRAKGETEFWDKCPYFGGRQKPKPK